MTKGSGLAFCTDILTTLAPSISLPRICKKRESFAPSLANQIALTDLAVEKDALDVGGEYLQTVTLKTLPEGMTFASMADYLCKLPFEFELSQSIRLLEQKGEVDKLKIKRRVSHAFAVGGKMTELEAEAQFDDTEALLREVLGSGEKILGASLTFHCARQRQKSSGREGQRSSHGL